MMQDKLAELHKGITERSKVADLLEKRSHERGSIGDRRTPEDVIRASGLIYKGELMGGSDVHMFEHAGYPGKTSAPSRVKDVN